MKKQFRFLFMPIVFILLVIVFSIAILRQSPVSASSLRGENAPTARTIYDPAPYGIPDVLAGYKVLAVLTSENTACIATGEKRLVLQSSQQQVDVINHSDAIDQELNKLGVTDVNTWEIMLVGPGITQEQFLAENEKWNTVFKKSECVKLGPITNPVFP